MKSCNDCVHHKVCERHNEMRDKVADRTYPVSVEFIMYCILHKEEILRLVVDGHNYMHEITEACVAGYCPDYLMVTKKQNLTFDEACRAAIKRYNKMAKKA